MKEQYHNLKITDKNNFSVKAATQKYKELKKKKRKYAITKSYISFSNSWAQTHKILWSSLKLKIAVLKKFNKLQENSERQFNDIRKKIHEKNELFMKDIETIRKNQ